MRPSNHEAFSGKNILLASTKPPWTNTLGNFEHVADHLTSPAMNFRRVILEEKYTIIFVNSLQNPSLIFTINPSKLYTVLIVFIFWNKMVKFFGGNGQVFISKKQKDLVVKSILFVLKSYGKMSLLDNQYELPWLESRLCDHLTTKRFLAKIFYLKAPNHLELTLQIILNMWQSIWPVQLWVFAL